MGLRSKPTLSPFLIISMLTRSDVVCVQESKRFHIVPTWKLLLISFSIFSNCCSACSPCLPVQSFYGGLRSFERLIFLLSTCNIFISICYCCNCNNFDYPILVMKRLQQKTELFLNLFHPKIGDLNQEGNHLLEVLS